MRILLTETVDPDGALYRWMSPELEALGHQVSIVPAQETVHYLGVSGWQRLLREITASWRPDLILVHPPYDHLNLETAQGLRRDGARLIAFAFDDALFLDAWQGAGVLGEVLRCYAGLFDVYFTTCRAMVEAATALGIKRMAYLRWALSASPIIASTADIPARAVLIGRAYTRRIDLVHRLADAGIPLLVRGHGWQDVTLPESINVAGYVDAGQRDTLLRQGVVISPGDWEDQTVPMVKARVLEAAFAGACQVTAECRELSDYFSPTEVPAYDSFSALVALLRGLLEDAGARAALAAAAYARARREHIWRIRFGELLDILHKENRPPRDSAPQALACSAYALVLQSLASAAEFGQRYAAAQAYYDLADSAGAGLSAQLGQVRCQFHLGRSGDAARGLHELIGPLSASVHPGQRHLRARLSSPAAGAGLGINRFLDPRVEALAYLLCARVRNNETDAALAILATLDDPDLLVQLASLLTPEDQGARFWQALFTAALAAKPLQLSQLQTEHATRWRTALQDFQVRDG